MYGPLHLLRSRSDTVALMHLDPDTVFEIPQLLRSSLTAAQTALTAVCNHAATLSTAVRHCSLFGRSGFISVQRLFGHRPPKLSRYSDSLQAGRSGDGIPVRARFSAPVQTGPGAHPALYTMSTGSFPGVMRPGRGVNPPPPSSAGFKERVIPPPVLGLHGLLLLSFFNCSLVDTRWQSCTVHSCTQTVHNTEDGTYTTI
jgi:hypothetical protein